MEKNRKSQLKYRQPMEQINKRLVLHVRLRCGSMQITTPVSFLSNELDVRRVLHEK